jgi:exosome complex RNA-binding protein Rrp42 (RNase PH superfamily)
MAIRCALQNLILPTLTPVTKHAQQQGEHGTISSSTGGKVSDDLILDGDMRHAVGVSSASKCPIIVTVYLLEKSLEKDITALTNINGMKIQKRGAMAFLVDARSEEEVCACAKVSVGVDPDGSICGIYSYGNSSSLNSTPSSIARGSMGSIPVASLHDVTKVALKASETVFSMLQLNETRTSSQEGQSFLDILKGCFELR